MDSLLLLLVNAEDSSWFHTHGPIPSHGIPSRNLVSYLTLRHRGKGKGIFILALNIKYQAASFCLRTWVLLLFQWLELCQGSQNSCVQLPVPSLPKASTHGNFKMRNVCLLNYLFNRETRRIAKVFVDGLGTLKNNVNIRRWPKSSVFCHLWGSLPFMHVLFLYEKDSQIRDRIQRQLPYGL